MEAGHPLYIPLPGRITRQALARITGLDALASIYDGWQTYAAASSGKGADGFLDFCLRELKATLQWRGADLGALPGTGPVIVAANHPLGCLEGMLMSRELLRLRPDTRVLANELLLRFPEFRELFIGVDVLHGDAAARNGAGMRAACRHLAGGGALLVFPAGTVAGYSLLRRRLEERPWNPVLGRLALRYGAACLPVHIRGRNRLPFYLSGYVHPRLRTALLPRELLAARGRSVEACAGELLSAREVRALGDDAAVTRCLRFAVDTLAPAGARRQPAAGESTRATAAIGGGVNPSSLAAEHERLAPYRLHEKGDLAVYCAPHAKLGSVMEQIAVERERTFRAVNEGTGRELDHDRFDPHYWHLWVWHRTNREIAGAYRIGRTDEIVREHGLRGLYSRSLYAYDGGFLDGMGPALEVGRSFVSLPYQRHSQVLDMLWRGIGAFMLANPGYHTLFGCVSISSHYSALARAFLADAMMTNFALAAPWCSKVRPSVPLRVRGKYWSREMLAPLNNVAVINKLLGQLDRGRRIPILLRHYLALNGRFVSFGVNRGFNDSLDGLIVVDLRRAPQRYLSRYMGEIGSRAFLANWEENDEQAA